MPENAPTDLQAALARLGALEAELARKDQIIEALQRRLFGRSSERLDPAQGQLGFDDATLGKPAPPPGDGRSTPGGEGEETAKRSRRKKAELFPENLKVVVDEVIVPEEVAADPGAFKEVGEEHHDELDVTRSEVFWRRTVRKKFVSKDDRSRPPLVAPAPEPSLPGTLCAPGLAAKLVVDKFCDHLPHYRQAKRLDRRHALKIGRATLNSWTHAVARHLAPVGEAIKGELFEAECLQVDESPIDYLCPGHGQTKSGYLWVYRDASGGTVYYDWQLGRGHDCLLEIIGLDEETGMTYYRGTVQCDGYSAYLALVARYGGVKLAGCLAHIRRNFYEAREQAPEVVLPILLEIQKLYRVEERLRDNKSPPACRMLVRLAQAKPIVERLKETFLEQTPKHLPKSNLGKALKYALGQWGKFCEYLHDGRLEIDNNLVENAIRPTKLGSKNYLFFGSAEAGGNNALLYTLIENCKIHGLDPELYLAEAIDRLPADPTPEQAAELTPSKVAARLARAAGAA